MHLILLKLFPVCMPRYIASYTIDHDDINVVLDDVVDVDDDNDTEGMRADVEHGKWEINHFSLYMLYISPHSLSVVIIINITIVIS